MSQCDPTLSFLSSPEIHVSGLVYVLRDVILCLTLSSCSSPPRGTPEPFDIPLGTHDRQIAFQERSISSTTLKHASVPAPDIETAPVENPVPLPSSSTPLNVEGYQRAEYVGPDKGVAPPWRVTVVLHGNYDRPEWQCETWKHVAGFHGFILCPRGVPTHWAPKSEDRWMYRGAEKTSKEINAAIEALKASYPGQIIENEMILVGFSLGAILSPGILELNPNRFRTLFLVEGLVDKLDKRKLRDIKRAGILRMGLAMSTGKYRAAAKQILKWNKKLDMPTVFVNMAGAGHNYHPEFPTMGREALLRLLQQP